MILTYYDKLKNSMCYLNIEKNKVTQFDASSLPKIIGHTDDGIIYTPTNKDSSIVTPTTSDINNQYNYNQIVFIPTRANKTDEPLLSLNSGKPIPIRIRTPKFMINSITSLLYKTFPVQPGALIKDIPYILTFCGECWVIDSYVAQFTQSDADTLSNCAQILAKLIDEKNIGFPIININQAISEAYISTTEQEVADLDDIVIPTTKKVEEMINKNITADLNNATQTDGWLGFNDFNTEQYICSLSDGKYTYNDGTYSIVYIDISTLPNKEKWVKIQLYSDETFLYLDVYFKNLSGVYHILHFSIEDLALTFPYYKTEFWNTNTFPKPTKSDIGKVPVAGQNGNVGWENIVNVQPYTTLTRVGADVTVHCHNLNLNKSYKLYLYTVSRHNGNKKGSWYHPNNFDVEPVNGESDHRMGYGKLGGKNIRVGEIFPNVPSWMPYNGFLLTEWLIPANKDSCDLEIPMKTWLIPMLKPTGLTAWTKEQLNSSTGPCISARLIGINNRNVAGLLFRFCLVDNDGIIYECKDTLRVGGKHSTSYSDARLFMTNDNSELFTTTIYTSII